MALPAGVTKLGSFKGAKGDKGDKGDTGTIARVTGTSIPYDQDSYVVMSGPQTDRLAAFFLQQGIPGGTAVNDDTAVSAYLLGAGTKSAAALFARISAPANCVFEGDSLTYGVYGTGVAWPNYPDQVATGLVGGSVTANVAAGGNTVAQMLTQANAEVDSKFDGSFVHNVAVLLGGINDLYVPRTPADVYADIVAWHQGRRTAGFKTVAVTILPATGNGPPAGMDANRLALNTLIRDNWASFADGFADAAMDPVFTAANVTLDKSIYHADAVHLTPRGYGELARIVRAGMAGAGVIGGGSLARQVGEWSWFRAASKPNGNVIVGHRTGMPTTDDTLTVAVGQRALDLLTTGIANVGVGQEALRNVDTGTNNTALGALAGVAAKGSRSTLIGAAAGYATTTGDHVVVGYRALYSNVDGLTNTVVGAEAVYTGTTVSETTAIGRQALRSATANYNTALGHRAGYAPGGSAANATTTGVQNVFIGHDSGSTGATESRGVSVGFQAQSGGSAVAVGYMAIASHANAVALGASSVTTAANQVMVGPRDVEITDATKGIVLKSANGTRRRITVNDAGTLVVAAA
jgi:lysophospholipase L1-like esterase